MHIVCVSTTRARARACVCVCVCVCVCARTVRARVYVYVYYYEKMRGQTAREQKKCSQILRYEQAANIKNSGRAARQILVVGARENFRLGAREKNLVGAVREYCRRRATSLDGVERRTLVDTARDNSRAKII